MIEYDDFSDEVIYKELTKTLKKMGLDELGRCEDCARVQDKHDEGKRFE